MSHISEGSEVTLLKKYAGDLDAMVELLRHRELEKHTYMLKEEALPLFKLAALLPVILKRLDLQDRIISGLDIVSKKKEKNNEHRK